MKESDNDIILRKDEHIAMRMIPSERLMVEVWTGYVPSATYREIMDESLRHAITYDVRRWFNDLREMGAILQPDEQWTKESWFPRLARTQVSRMAFLMSSDFFNQMSVDRIMSLGTELMPLEVGYFGEIKEARSWLFSAKPTMKSA